MERQAAFDGTINPEVLSPPPEELSHRVIAYAAELQRGGGGIGAHRHSRAQLLATQAGSIAVTTDEGTYVVPRERALWIPEGLVHETRHLAAARVRTLYIRPDAAASLPARISVVQISPLLRCLIDACMRLPRRYDEAGADGRLISVLLDQIAASDVVPLRVPLPQSAALRAMADAVLADPADARRVDEWARSAGLSARTLERRFKSETGFTFRSFRVQAKLLRAVELLAEAHSVAQISDRLGFESPSTFVAMFRSAFGVTPGRYFKHRDQA